MENKNYIVGIDLGSHRIVGAVGRMGTPSQGIVLDKTSATATKGMYQGGIDSPEDLRSSLDKVLQELSQGIQVPIQDLYVCHSNANVSEAYLQSCMPEHTKIKQCFSPLHILQHGLCKEEQLKAGIGIINIGAEYTQVSIFKDGQAQYAKSFPCGSQWISSDIAELCKDVHVSPGIAELLKKQVGLVLDRDNEKRSISFQVQGQDVPQRISKLKVSDIIEARIEEWAEAVQYINGKVNEQKQPALGWILTGNGSLLKNLDEFLSQRWECEVKRQGPIVQVSAGNVFAQGDPSYASAIGLLYEGAKHGPNKTGKIEKKEKSNPLKMSGIQDIWKDNAEYL